MASGDYDAVFVGGGLAATPLPAGLRAARRARDLVGGPGRGRGGRRPPLLRHGMRAASPERVLIVDPEPPTEGPPVHWSYWSRDPTPYDRLSIGAWRRAGARDLLPEPISPFTLRLVRSTDVLASLEEALEGLPIEQRRVTARSVRLLPGGLYEVATDEEAGRARRGVGGRAGGASPPVRLGSCPAGSTRSPPTKKPSAPAGCSTAHPASPRASLLKAALAPC